MPILPNGVEKQTTPFHAPTGGSPRGWTFISTAIECWRKWAFKYVFGIYPLENADALSLGSAYHALMEGLQVADVERIFPGFSSRARELQRRRLDGPPLPPLSDSVIVEKEFDIFDGMMTSKPDRIEKDGKRTVVRDFKTAMNFSDNDEAYWSVDGGILGECIAADTNTAVVDIVAKVERKGPNVKLVTVTLTEEKREALRQTVRQFWADAEWRTKETAKRKNIDAYSQNLKSCVGKYGPCPYYARCWKKGTPESMLFKTTVDQPFRWATHAGGIDWMKALEKAHVVGRKP